MDILRPALQERTPQDEVNALLLITNGLVIRAKLLAGEPIEPKEISPNKVGQEQFVLFARHIGEKSINRL